MSNGNATIIGAVILGLALLGGSYQIGRSVEKAGAEIQGLKAAIADMGTAMAAAAQPQRQQAAAPQRGPDPNRRYEIALAGSPVRGPEKAKITIIEFSDFQCPFCRRVGPTLDQIVKEYGSDVRISFKHLPLDFHTKAPDAHAASIAAGFQGKFWEMHDKIFEDQQAMSAEKYVEYAGQLGLDVERFKKDVASAEVKKRIDDDKLEAAKLGVTGTPSFFINGRFLSGAQPFEAFKVVIDRELQAKGDA